MLFNLVYSLYISFLKIIVLFSKVIGIDNSIDNSRGVNILIVFSFLLLLIFLINL